MARWLIFPLMIAELKSIWDLMKDKEAPKRHKLVVILGLIYLLSPVDLIPLPVIGLNIVDDIVIWAAILYYLKEPLSKYREKGSGAKKGRKKYEDKVVVEVEDFVVMEDKENQNEE